MRELVIFLAQSVVDEPDAVTVEEKDHDGKLLYLIHVAPSDVGKLIGKQGRVIQAIRHVVFSAHDGPGRPLIEVAQAGE